MCVSFNLLHSTLSDGVSFSLPGPPLSRLTSVTTLLAANVTVGLGVEEAWNARNTRFEIGWVRLHPIFNPKPVLNSTRFRQTSMLREICPKLTPLLLDLLISKNYWVSTKTALTTT